ncbi:MAG: hypothetical protein V1926_06480 [Candidatus Peregrinibacteria bacterium]
MESSFLRIRRISGQVMRSLAIAALLLCGVTQAAASSWNPTLLVNTESFNTIDSGDGTTDIELKFGDTGNIRMFWDKGTSRFEFTRPIMVQGNITASGGLSVRDVMSGGALRVDNNADIWGKLSVSGATVIDGSLSTAGTLSASGTVFLEAGQRIVLNGVSYLFPYGAAAASGKVLKSDTAGNLVWATDDGTTYNAGKGLSVSNNYFSLNDVITGSTLRVTGDISGSGNLSIDGTSYINGAAVFGSTLSLNGVTYTFPYGDGAASGRVLKTDGAGHLVWATDIDTDTNTLYGAGKGLTLSEGVFSLNDVITGSTLKVSGAMSGKTLQVDGNASIYGNLSVSGALKLNGVAYTLPSSQGGTNTILKNDGNGTLSWSATTGVGSGGVLALSPEYPNAVYFSTGAITNYIGQLSYDYDETNKQNFYHWATTKADLQEYWIAVRVRIPDNFSAWDTIRPIQFNYRTAQDDDAVNHLTMRLLDTAGTEIALTGGNKLKSANAWTVATVTGPEAAGTYTQGSYITLLIKVNTTTAGSADAGYVNLNIETTSP